MAHRFLSPRFWPWRLAAALETGRRVGVALASGPWFSTSASRAMNPRTPEGLLADVHLVGYAVPPGKGEAADLVSGWKDLWVKRDGRWKNKTGDAYVVDRTKP